MALKVGNRVTVKAGVSNRKDAGSMQESALRGHDLGLARAHCVGKRGEVVAIDGDKYLVDDQYKDGVPVGSCTMREWFTESELEVG